MILYALVARGSFVLAEYTSYDGDFPSVARRILSKFERTKHKKTLSKEEYSFTLFSDEDFTFLCMNKCQVPKEVSYRFLDDMASSFFSKHRKNEDKEAQSGTAQFTVSIKDLIVYSLRLKC